MTVSLRFAELCGIRAKLMRASKRLTGRCSESRQGPTLRFCLTTASSLQRRALSGAVDLVSH